MPDVKLLWIHALSPIHCGTGQGVDGIDLPIAREKPTGIPFIPGSSIKGVLRGREECKGLHKAAFGPDTNQASEHAGSVQFSDAHLVFLPVRSVKGTFAYVTSRYMLQRLARDAKEAGITLVVPAAPELGRAWTVSPRIAVGNQNLVCEDLSLTVTVSADLRAIAETVSLLIFGKPTQPPNPNQPTHPEFTERVCMVHDDVMDLLLNTCMEIFTRNRLDPDTKTVAKGALWTEEALPVESVLCGLVLAGAALDGSRSTATELLAHVRTLTSHAIQLGGKATIGRGLCSLKMGA